MRGKRKAVFERKDRPKRVNKRGSFRTRKKLFLKEDRFLKATLDQSEQKVILADRREAVLRCKGKTVFRIEERESKRRSGHSERKNDVQMSGRESKRKIPDTSLKRQEQEERAFQRSKVTVRSPDFKGTAGMDQVLQAILEMRGGFEEANAQNNSLKVELERT